MTKKRVTAGARPSQTDAVVPATGQPAGIVIDGRTVYLWWGPESAEGEDVVASVDGRVRLWVSEQECWAAAAAAGWATEGGFDADEPLELQDFSATEEWIAGKRTTVEPISALELWNFAGDIARSAGRPWDQPSGDLSWDCYNELLAANVPWAFDLEEYTPRWSPRELTALRGILTQALAIVRGAL